MDIGQIIFISIAVMWVVCFLRIPLISWDAIKYVKRKYPQEWNNEFQHQIGTSIFGGRTVFQFFSKLGDPVIDNLKKKWETALRQLLFSVLFASVLVGAYIFTMVK
ncbi:MAG: hypothetical protein A2511_12390 [Deltaproteobacteria bacterium RIFOXYD12_FULL_50_9]|nr:MAG: hypothetical protein A2511_12390 [Deltaproteobacteria bacterium RIFOXYD12_FULL_50_9]